MAQSAELSLPKIELELLEDLSPSDPTGFLRLVRRRYRAKYPDGSHSNPFLYDAVDRNSLDAVIIAAHFLTESGQRRVYLRSSLRPPITARDPARSTLDGERFDGLLWELPAGMIDVAELSPAGVPRAARRELLEELGFDVPLDALQPLGPSMFPVPGFCAERQFYFEVAVNPNKRQEPGLDGSALEHFGVVVDVALNEALDLCRRGVIEDSKTELALRRLEERFA
ncbi:MAG: NUDIX hydrolase [Polyangiaceae bacterium]